MGFLGSLFKPDPEKLMARGDLHGLIQALRYKKDPKVRSLAAVALGDMTGERAEQALAGALSDEDERVRTFVAANLVKIGTPTAMQALSRYKRAHCASCGGSLSSDREVQPLGRGFDFADAVARASQILQTAGRQCECGAVVHRGCQPADGSDIPCPFCGSAI